MSKIDKKKYMSSVNSTLTKGRIASYTQEWWQKTDSSKVQMKYRDNTM